MEKVLSFLLLSCFSASLFAQTIVSTNSSNKNAVLEEFTGIRCAWCPAAHKIAHQLMDAHPNRFFTISVHQGGYAEGIPNYTTPFGDPLMAKAGPPSGYPTGSINRQTFGSPSGSSHYLYDRGQWSNHTNTVLAQASCVNVAAEGAIDWNTRVLTLLVEVYYTANAPQPVNKLTVAMLQNEILGPQAGMLLNSEMIIDDLYRHQHMLRDFITGQWGVDVSPTTAGSFWTHTFTYNIPPQINDIEVALEDLEFLVFIAENEEKIITAAHANITHLNLPDVAARIVLLNEIEVYNCSGDASAFLTVKNLGATSISSIELKYTVADGTPNIMQWNNRTIPTMTIDTIHLPVFQVQINEDQILNVDLAKINNQTVSTLPKSIIIHKSVPTGDIAMTFILATDKYASETTFKIFNPDGSILLQGGPWTDCGWMCVTVREFNFIPVMKGEYRVEIYDSRGDGINMGEGAGYLELYNRKGERIWYNDGTFGYKVTVMVKVDEISTLPFHTITSSTGINGTISPLGKRLIMEGETPEYIFIPNDKYEVKEVLIDGVSIGLAQATSYTFPAVDKDYAIKVTFRVAQQGDVKDANGVSISIAPNPVDNELLVTGMYDKLEIISLTGQTLATFYNQPILDVSHLPKGIFFAKIQINGQTATFKLVK